MSRTTDSDILDAVVVGAGWAGLGVSHALKRQRPASSRAGAGSHRRDLADTALGLIQNEYAQCADRHAGGPL